MTLIERLQDARGLLTEDAEAWFESNVHRAGPDKGKLIGNDLVEYERYIEAIAAIDEAIKELT